MAMYPKVRVYQLRARNGNGEELKCGGCNWHVSNLFVLATNKKEALGMYRRREAGLCGDCFGEMLRGDMPPIIIDAHGEILRVKPLD
jgi:hypothetical protein